VGYTDGKGEEALILLENIKDEKSNSQESSKSLPLEKEAAIEAITLLACKNVLPNMDTDMDNMFKSFIMAEKGFGVVTGRDYTYVEPEKSNKLPLLAPVDQTSAAL
jgi:intracellular sulfur oxidation DsrE/DsrF family protein